MVDLRTYNHSSATRTVPNGWKEPCSLAEAFPGTCMQRIRLMYANKTNPRVGRAKTINAGPSCPMPGTQVMAEEESHHRAHRVIA
jgi:hypothetical protein